MADIGAGGGRHLIGISHAVGAQGALVATEISDSRCDGLREAVASAEAHRLASLLGGALAAAAPQSR